MFHHTDILTGGGFNASTPSLKTHAAVIETENRIWQELDTRESVCGKRPSLALLPSRQARKRTLPVNRCWLLITRLDVPSPLAENDRWKPPAAEVRRKGQTRHCATSSTPLKRWQPFPAVHSPEAFRPHQIQLIELFVVFPVKMKAGTFSLWAKFFTKWLSTHLLMVENAE